MMDNYGIGQRTVLHDKCGVFRRTLRKGKPDPVYPGRCIVQHAVGPQHGIEDKTTNKRIALSGCITHIKACIGLCNQILGADHLILAGGQENEYKSDRKDRSSFQSAML